MTKQERNEAPPNMKGTFLRRRFDQLITFFDNNSFRITLLIVLVGFVFLLAIRIASILIVESDPWIILENSVVYSIQRMLGGYGLYTDPEVPPYAITQYSPLYYYIIYWSCRLFNIEAGDILSIYYVSRTASLFFNLLFAGITSAISYRIFKTSNQVALLIGMIAFLLFEPHAYSRPDSMYNAAVLLVIFLYLLYLKNHNSSRSAFLLICVSLVTVVAIFSKQTGIILPVLLLFYQLFILKNFRGVIVLLVGFIFFIPLFMWLFNNSSLQIFYKNVVLGVDNGIDLKWFAYYIIDGYFFSIKGLLIAPLGIYAATQFIRSDSREKSFLGWSFLALFAFAILTGLKYGSMPSYFTEANAVALVGIALIKDRIKIPGIAQVFYAGAICLMLMVDVKTINLALKKTEYSKNKYKLEKEVFQYFSSSLPLQKDEHVFVDLEGWKTFMGGLFYERGMFPNKDIVDCCAYPRRVYDYSNFAMLKREGKIKYVITNRNNISYVGVDFNDYKKIKEINGLFIYESPISPHNP